MRFLNKAKDILCKWRECFKDLLNLVTHVTTVNTLQLPNLTESDITENKVSHAISH